MLKYSNIVYKNGDMYTSLIIIIIISHYLVLIVKDDVKGFSKFSTFTIIPNRKGNK